MQVGQFHVEELPPFEPGNAFNQDHWNMGTRVEDDLLVMYGNFGHNQHYIIVNEATGARIRLTVPGGNPETM